MSSEKIDMGHLSPKHYVQIWAVLVVLLALSMLAGLMKSALLGTVLIFGVAFIKAAIVLACFMHLTIEYVWLKVFVGFGILCAIFFILGVFPDVAISQYF